LLDNEDYFATRQRQLGNNKREEDVSQ
jgi:hypothetical protein